MSNDGSILHLMKKLVFFVVFTDSQIEYLSKLKNNILSCRAGERIVRQGDFDTSLIILIKGRVKIFKTERPQVILASLTPGTIFGEIAFLKHLPRTANVVAETDLIYLNLDCDSFDTMDPLIQNKFRSRFLDILIGRLDDLNRRYIRDAQISNQRCVTKRLVDRDGREVAASLDSEEERRKMMERRAEERRGGPDKRQMDRRQ